MSTALLSKLLPPISASLLKERHLLAMAAVAEQAKALDAWQEWKNSYLSSEHSRLETRYTPEIYRRFKSWGIKDETLGLLRQARQTTWYRNNALLQSTQPIFRALADEDIPLFLLKGAGLSLGYCRDLGYRYLGDIDLLIPYNEAERAYAIIEKLQWKERFQYPPEQFFARHGRLFNSTEHGSLDLHWHATFSCCRTMLDDELKSNALDVELFDIPCKVFAREELLFHTLIHGQYDNAKDSYWMLDAKRLIEHDATAVDWTRIAYLAKISKTTVLLQHSLTNLVKVNDTLIPVEDLRQVQSRSCSYIEKIESFVTHHGVDSILGGLPSQITEYWRSGFADQSIGHCLGFLHYMRWHWKLSSNWQLPLKAITISFSVIKRIIVGEKS